MNKKIKKKLKKVMTSVLILNVTFSSIFIVPIKVNADETYIGKITKNDVRLRSEPTTLTKNGINNIIAQYDAGKVVTVLNLTKEKDPEGSGCKDGWYKVKIDENTGYVCSTYVSLDGLDIYDRPWTSPKKAIVGGAKFIGGSYIARGQNTSYLKKFQVNPNSHYDMFTHQYMANLQAPSSEAKTSWNAYVNNGLSELPLIFSIPIFENMAEAYNRPGGNLIEVERQLEVTDQEFENYLNNAGFPDSYKPALRALHTKHPNWIFEAMKTNANFNDAVLIEKNVCSIQGGNQYYELVNGSPYQTEKGWYLANNETVAYFLDPRNFLTETYVLQFEKLSYSENYTASVVQSILNNTFMSGLSILDNQTYAEIFVEAGKTADVSPVYLASLARQESGTTEKMTTSGNQFEYEGVIYSGLFNFFNIGAYSSASNPAKAGLVYASGGLCTVCSNDQTSVPVLKLANYASAAGYQVKSNYIKGFEVGENINNIKNKMLNTNISIETTNDIIATGTNFTFDGETYTAVLYGDLSGDGKINSADLLKMRQHLQGTNILSGAYFEAGALVNGNSINSADLLKLRQHLLGTNIISQK